MSGIAGQVRFDGNTVDSGLLEKMGLLLEHRGRDGTSVYAHGPCGLMLKRLSLGKGIEGESSVPSAAQGRVMALLDGYFINAQELRLAWGTPPDTEDAELLLRGYSEYGEKVFDALDGIFAAAILDLDKGTLLLVRDRVGAKPLYYHACDKAFSFASEVKALVKSGCAKAVLDRYGLKEFLNLQMYVDDRTLFEGISAVLPAHYVKVSFLDGKVDQFAYWVPPAGTLSLSYDEAVEELLRLLNKAMEQNCRTDAAVGAFISGGLDSSTMAALASRYVGGNAQSKLRTYSSVYPDMHFEDEQVYSDAVAEMIGSLHKRVRLPNEQVIKDHEDLIYMLDMPCAGFSAPYRTLAGIVRRDVKTVLTGHGGDEFFCGYPRTIIAALADALAQAKDSRPFTFDVSLLPYLEKFEPLARSILGNALFADRKTLVKTVVFRGPQLSDALSDKTAVADSDYDLAQTLLDKMERCGGGIVKQLMHIDQNVELTNLLHVEDRTHMAENLEARIPMLSRGILEFALQLPESFYLKKGLKSLLRSTGQQLLPPIVSNKIIKSGTMFPVQELFFGTMYPSVKAKLSVLDETGWFSQSALSLAESPKTGQRDVWALWGLACWAETYL